MTWNFLLDRGCMLLLCKGWGGLIVSKSMEVHRPKPEGSLVLRLVEGRKEVAMGL